MRASIPTFLFWISKKRTIPFISILLLPSLPLLFSFLLILQPKRIPCHADFYLELMYVCVCVWLVRLIKMRLACNVLLLPSDFVSLPVREIGVSEIIIWTEEKFSFLILWRFELDVPLLRGQPAWSLCVCVPESNVKRIRTEFVLWRNWEVTWQWGLP